jgi:hypothetical protein
MSPSIRSVLAVSLAAVYAASSPAAPPVHESKEPRVVSKAHAKFTMVQDGQEVGHEHVTRTLFDNNTIRFEGETVARSSAVTMTNRSELVIEEESYFPRSYRADKTIQQPSEAFTHAITVDMYANVAFLTSELRGSKGSRRLVVPTGLAIQEVGQLYPWYQLLFWVDPKAQGRQSIQWLDPSTGEVERGELYAAGEETVDVLGKPTRATVYKAERVRYGPATLYVDSRRRIVKAEQNMLTYRLDEWTEEAGNP